MGGVATKFVWGGGGAGERSPHHSTTAGPLTYNLQPSLYCCSPPSPHPSLNCCLPPQPPRCLCVPLNQPRHGPACQVLPLPLLLPATAVLTTSCRLLLPAGHHLLQLLLRAQGSPAGHDESDLRQWLGSPRSECRGGWVCWLGERGGCVVCLVGELPPHVPPPHTHGPPPTMCELPSPHSTHPHSWSSPPP